MRFILRVNIRWGKSTADPPNIAYIYETIMTRNIHPVINIFLGLLRPFIYANFWVAGAVWALTRLSEFQLTQWWEVGTFNEYGYFLLNPSFAGLNAAGTLIVYGFARLFESPGDEGTQSKISQWRSAMPKLHNSAWGLAFLWAIWWALYGSWIVSCTFICRCHCCGRLVPLPFILRKSGGGLRSIPGLKLLVIAAFGAYVTAVIPECSGGEPGIGVFFERFCWTRQLPALRRSGYDGGSKQHSHFAAYLGLRNTAWMANLMLSGSAFISRSIISNAIITPSGCIFSARSLLF